MNYLFIHNNFPGQFQHIAGYLARQPGNRVIFLSQPNENRMTGVETLFYTPFRPVTAGVHHYVADIEQAVIWGQSVHEACRGLKAQGFRPDVVIGHSGWGETLFLKDVWPDVPVLAYFEFYYHASGHDVGFDPAEPPGLNDGPRLRLKNAVNLMAAQSADWGLTPTRWQASLYPPDIRKRILVQHEGVDTALASPGVGASIQTPAMARPLTAGDEVITFVNRNLEPYRGFRVFMRALPEIQARRPRAQVLIIGGDGLSYGAPPPGGGSWRQTILDEVGERLDMSRVHFLGHLPYPDFIALMQLSSVHVYLTYPFVLSWSLLESMACGCAVVASDVAPVREVIQDGRNGLLVDFFDQTALCSAIDRVLDHPDRMKKMREAARKTVIDRYDLATVALPRHVALVQAVAEGRDPKKAMVQP
jgi:glycosyltransferase involved in cell wall biosynthesis